jgi:anti-anti-sigma factor
MQITEDTNDAVTTLHIRGRIDTQTNAILKALQKAKDLTLDFQNVDYISSAGLRALLIGQKTANAKKANMRIINTNQQVISTLQMVGFTNIISTQ